MAAAMKDLKWKDIRAGAKIAGVDPYELRRRLLAKSDHAPSLPLHLADRNAWVDAAADFIASMPMEFNAELLACHIYDRFVKFPPKR